MNAIRQIVTPDAAGNLPLQVPAELRQRPVEVIILPLEETDDPASLVLKGPNATANAWKIIRKPRLANLMEQSIAMLQQQANQNGLTPALLDELLKDNDCGSLGCF